MTGIGPSISRNRKDRSTPLLIETPVASPALTSFNTLPQHYIWMEAVKRGQFGANLLPGGSFEEAEKGEIPEGWWTWAMQRRYQVDDHGLRSRKGGWTPKSRKMLELNVRTDKKHPLDSMPAFLDHPIVAVQTPPMKVGKGQLIRIRAMVKMIIPTPPGAGGLSCATRSEERPSSSARPRPTGPEWRDLVLYRRVVEDGDLTLFFGPRRLRGRCKSTTCASIGSCSPAGANIEPSSGLARRPAPRPPAVNPARATR